MLPGGWLLRTFLPGSLWRTRRMRRGLAYASEMIPTDTGLVAFRFIGRSSLAVRPVVTPAFITALGAFREGVNGGGSNSDGGRREFFFKKGC